MNAKRSATSPEIALTEPPSVPGDYQGIDAYIKAIGQRVRGARARRGMTRKDLSQHSEISQRYLAQVETGQANISVGLLSRIAQALNLDIHELLPQSRNDRFASQAQLKQLLERLSQRELAQAQQLLADHFAQAPLKVHGIALVGLRGGGKSTLGRLLANSLGIPFIRLGNVIESLAGMDIPELFARSGQEAYRQVEKEAVQYVLDSYEKVVLETGGSLVSELGTYNLVINSFYTVWVQASPAEHMERVIEQGDLRPIQGNRDAMEDLKLILEERRPQYEAAHYALNTSGRTVQECLLELQDVCSSHYAELSAHPNSANAPPLPG
jgi:XRE family aerobic/anaerobic benzoate catabolism transcriptional regulator